MSNFKLGQRLWGLLFSALCLVGCGGDDSLPALPHAISYKSLIGAENGPVYGDSTPILYQLYAYCEFGKPCLFAFTALKTKEAFQNYIAQSPGIALSKPQVLALGNAVDFFSREQIWAFKYGVSSAGVNLRLGITETATQIEVQAKVCNPIVVDAPVRLLDVFAIVANDLPAKPVVIVNDTHLPNPCYV